MIIKLHAFQVVIRKNDYPLMIIFIKNTSFLYPEHITVQFDGFSYSAEFWIGFCIIFKFRQNASKCTRTVGPVGGGSPHQPPSN